MIKIAICDDEKEDIEKAYQIIRCSLDKKNINFNISTFMNSYKLLKSTDVYDIIFLDIEMGEIDGIQAGQVLSKFDETSIIYMTNYNEYCIQAINHIHAYAFLEKPLNFKEVDKQLISLLCSKINCTKKKKLNFEIFKITEHGEIKKNIKEFIINDIYYFSYVNRRILVKLSKDEYFISGKLRDIETKMEENYFARCHQSFIVNINHVVRIHKYEVFLDNDKSLPVSQRKSAAFRKKVNEYIHTIM